MFLMGAFIIIVLKRSAKEAWDAFKSYHLRATPYRDASTGPCQYKCTVEHCLKGLDIAIKLGWYDYDKFDLISY